MAAVGELQLQVFQSRMESEYNEIVNLERLPYTRTRWIGGNIMPAAAIPIAYDDQNRPVAMFKTDWELNYQLQRTEGLVLLESPKVE